MSEARFTELLLFEAIDSFKDSICLIVDKRLITKK